jgi:acyl-CoA synthetase (AMP-forming)/AMP-acid ligase II
MSMDLAELRAAAQQVADGLTAPGAPFELVEQDVLGARMPVFKNRRRSLGELVRDSLRFGDRTYIATAAAELSFVEHARQVASLAAALRDEYDVQPGDRVAIAAANSPEWITAFWAAASLGAITIGFNAWWARGEVAYALGHAEPKVVIADAKRAAVLAGAGVAVPVLSVEADLPRLAGLSPDALLPDVTVREDDPATILYTSGTSGRPKGVLHTHRNLLAVLEYHRFNDALGAAFGDPTPPEDKRYLLAMPLFHIASLHNLAVPRLATGSAAVIHQGAFHVDRVLRLIEQRRVTNWGAVPTMANRLLEHGDLSRYDLSSLRSFALASAPSSSAFKARLRAALPFAEQALADSYGLTETSTACTVASALDLADAPDSVGRPIVTVQLEVRDENDTAVPEGVAGEVCVRSLFVMLVYWRDPEATAAAIRDDRWLHTGDIGMIEQGRLRLSSRRSDLILRGGENVYPVEVEQVLAEHPLVRESAVFGLDHADLGQEVAAVVVVDDVTALTDDDLAKYVADNLAYYKVPTRWRLTTRAPARQRDRQGRAARDLPLTRQEASPMSLQELLDIQACQQLKYRYCRLLDQKRFDELGELLVEDCTVAYGGGAITLQGRASVTGYLHKAMGDTRILTSHIVSHPEIDVSGDEAGASWVLHDVVILQDAGLAIRGASYYDDRYVRTADGWRIAHTGYRRLYEEIAKRPDGVRTTASWWETDGRSSLV